MSTINPPNVGPNIAKTITASPYKLIAIPLLLGGNAASKIDCDNGVIGPPPIPCMSRPRTIKFKFGATAQISEPSVKIPINIFKKRFLPRTLSIHPDIKIKHAFAIIYDVIIQFASSIVEPKYPEICGIATFVADVARQEKDVGSNIENATSHKGAASDLEVLYSRETYLMVKKEEVSNKINSIISTIGLYKAAGGVDLYKINENI